MADSEPAWLDINMLDYYQHKYPSLPLYGYDPASTEKRGKKCAKNLLTLIPRKNVNTFLELGC